MIVRKCSERDVSELALLNKQLIEDEQSDNQMTVRPLSLSKLNYMLRS